MAEYLLEINNLEASVIEEDKEDKGILKGVDLKIKAGETHVLMGSNGSGKSTLAHTLMGHPNYPVTSGGVAYKEQNLLEMAPEDRAKSGLFLAFQYPTSIPGLSVVSYLRSIMKAIVQEDISFREFKTRVTETMKELDIPQDFLNRSLNEGFSGGEKKRMEILQMLLLNPTLAILDETDSGLDVDAMKNVFNAIKKNKKDDNSLLVITHYNKIVQYIEPDRVHIMKDGRIVKSGGIELSHRVETEGFEAVIDG